MPDADNDHDRETDEWVVPAELRPPKPTLGRDGGEPKETR